MYLGLDLGDKRCGVSIFLHGVVVPKGIYPRHSLVLELKKLIKSYDISTIVVGLPYDLYGKDLKQLDKTKSFIEKLKVFFPDIKIDSIDERYTSFEADLILDSLGVKDKVGKKDDLSAVMILERYLKKFNL